MPLPTAIGRAARLALLVPVAGIATGCVGDDPTITDKAETRPLVTPEGRGAAGKAATRSPDAGKEQYITTVRRILAQTSDLEELRSSVSEAGASKELQAAIRRTEREVERVRRMLDAVDAPQRVVLLHERLLQAHDDFLADLSLARRTVAAGETAAAGIIGTAADAYHQIVSDLNREFLAQGYGPLL